MFSKITNYLLTALACVLLLGFMPDTAAAQVRAPGETKVDSTVKNAVLPALSYTSDLGLIGGGIYNRFDYRGDAQPFRSYLQMYILASTKGYLQAKISYDRTRTFDTDLRSLIELRANRIFKNTYFGVGNGTPYSDNRYNNGYNYFESASIELTYEGRQPLYNKGRKRLDVLLLGGTAYHIPWTDDATLMELNPPRGIKGGWVNYLGTGLLWENRDSEFNPTVGNRVELRLRAAPSFLLTDFPMSAIMLDARQYFHFHLLRKVVVANRILGRYATGKVPYWEMSNMGDEMQMRGLAYNRLMAPSKLVHTLELRTWLLEFEKVGIKIGGQLFTETGRVFGKHAGWNELTENYTRTYGLGGALSLFSPDFIIRGDLGFSDEMTRFYVSVGYAF